MEITVVLESQGNNKLVDSFFYNSYLQLHYMHLYIVLEHGGIISSRAFFIFQVYINPGALVCLVLVDNSP